MTQNRPCSDSLPEQAMHNGFRNTTGLIMVQLVSLNTRKGKKRQNGGNVAIHRGNGKHKKTVLRERKDKERKEKQRARGDKKMKDKEKSRIREILMSIYSMLFRSPITVQVSSCDLGGFDRSGSPW